MKFEVSSKVVATAMGLAGFAIAVIAGLHAGNPTATILTNAILCMVACQFVGLFIGSVGERVVREHVASMHEASAGGAAGGVGVSGATVQSAPGPGV